MQKGLVTRSHGGRIAGTVGLTDRQTAYVKAYVRNGGNADGAAREAGYANPHCSGWQVLQLPHVREAIHDEQSRKLRGLASLALGTLEDILRDEDAPLRVKADVAIKVLDRAGHVAPKPAEVVENPEKKPMSEWSVEELEDFIRRGQAAMDSSKAAIVDGVCESVDTDQDATLQ